MLPEPVTETLVRPSVRRIRDRKLELLDEWEAKNGQPGEIIVRRGYDSTQDAMIATITIRSAVPRGFNWSRQ